MATINAANIDKAQIIKYYRQNKNGGLIELPFHRIKIDFDADFFEPNSFDRFGPPGPTGVGLTQRGTIVGQEIFNKNLPLPRAVSGRFGKTGQDQIGVWQLGNV